MTSESSFQSSEKIVTDIADIEGKLIAHRRRGATVALCHGVFDLLHPGHLRHFRASRGLADVLVVSITADQFVNKGPGRPAFSQELRAEALAELASVDFVIVTPSPTGLPAIEAVRPDVYVKGSDYSNHEDDPTGNIQLERDAVEKLGGRIEFTDELVFSSSTLINQYLSQVPSSTRQWISEVQHEYGIEGVLHWLEQISGLRVGLLGETIIDAYTKCEALGKASKEPILCFSRGASVQHAGGVLAVAGHCRGLGAATSVVTAVNSQDWSASVLSEVQRSGIDIAVVDTSPRPTIRKERLIDATTENRLLEIYDLDDSPLPAELDQGLLAMIDRLERQSDLLIVTDYGHGLISDATVRRLADSPAFVALNVQSNAGNRGLNSISKHSRADFLTLNGGELRLETRRHHADPKQYIPDLMRKMRASGFLVTAGSEGLDLYSNGGAATHAPALAPYVRDRVGAGDAVLSITAMLSKVGAPPKVVAFLGSVVGAWAVTFLGNERVLDGGQLRRQVESILK